MARRGGAATKAAAFWAGRRVWITGASSGIGEGTLYIIDGNARRRDLTTARPNKRLVHHDLQRSPTSSTRMAHS